MRVTYLNQIKILNPDISGFSMGGLKFGRAKCLVLNETRAKNRELMQRANQGTVMQDAGHPCFSADIHLTFRLTGPSGAMTKAGRRPV